MIPLALAAYATQCLNQGQAQFWGRKWQHVTLQGEAATALAVAYLALAATIHFRGFWHSHDRLGLYSNTAMGLSLLVFLGAFVYFIRLFMLL